MSAGSFLQPLPHMFSGSIHEAGSRGLLCMRPVVASNRMMLVANCMSKWDGKDSHSTHKMCFVLSN